LSRRTLIIFGLVAVAVAALTPQAEVRVFGLGTVWAQVVAPMGFEVGAALVEVAADHDLADARRADAAAALAFERAVLEEHVLRAPFDVMLVERHAKHVCVVLEGWVKAYRMAPTGSEALVGQIEQFKAQSSAQRVAEFLASLCVVEDGAGTVTLPYDKALIAGRLGMKPESLSRSRPSMRWRIRV
jgi:hypothetical protein